MNPAHREERAKSTREIRARMALIANERGLPKSETAGRLSTYGLYLFSRRHHVDIEWPIRGRLTDLLKNRPWQRREYQPNGGVNLVLPYPGAAHGLVGPGACRPENRRASGHHRLNRG